jgi:hypothetical protein
VTVLTGSTVSYRGEKDWCLATNLEWSKKLVEGLGILLAILRHCDLSLLKELSGALHGAESLDQAALARDFREVILAGEVSIIEGCRCSRTALGLSHEIECISRVKAPCTRKYSLSGASAKTSGVPQGCINTRDQ